MGKQSWRQASRQGAVRQPDEADAPEARSEQRAAAAAAVAAEVAARRWRAREDCGWGVETAKREVKRQGEWLVQDGRERHARSK